LQKGDIVTANQLKGNKIRIIKWCPAGCEIEFDLLGWVLLKTKNIHQLRRIDHRRAKKFNGKSRSRSAVVSPLSLIQKIVGQNCTTSKKQICHKSNPQRVSSTNFSPFVVLEGLEVYKGRRQSAVIGWLKPGRIVWANQHKGSMFRIMKMDERGNIVVDANLKPKNWGWVYLRRKGDSKPRLVSLPLSYLTKTEKFMNIQSPRDTLGSKDHFCANKQTPHRARTSQKDHENRISKFVKQKSRSQGKKQFNILLSSDLEECVSRSRQYNQAKSMKHSEETKVGVSFLHSDVASRIIAEEE